MRLVTPGRRRTALSSSTGTIIAGCRAGVVGRSAVIIKPGLNDGQIRSYRDICLMTAQTSSPPPIAPVKASMHGKTSTTPLRSTRAAMQPEISKAEKNLRHCPGLNGPLGRRTSAERERTACPDPLSEKGPP